MFFDIFEDLCQRKGVKPGRACSEMGFSRSLAAKWKATGTERPSADVLEKMSIYFKMSIDEILGYKKETPAESGERTLTFDDFTYAMHEASKNLSERDKQILLGMAEQLKKAKDKE